MKTVILGGSVIVEIFAGIVTYNPSIERLTKNIDAVRKQANEVYVVDNDSRNRVEIEQCINNLDCSNVHLVKCDSNNGIAKALNIVFQKALEMGVTWVLTLDQDSEIPYNLLAVYKKHIDSNVAQIACNLIESQTQKIIYKNDSELSEVSRCITSGTLTSVEAWKLVEGFDENLFMDYVDYDISMKFKKKGYRIIRCNSIFMEHELGNSEMHYFLFIPVRVTNYSPMRKYYIARNIVIYIKRYCNFIGGVIESLRLLRLIVYALIYEDDKNVKMKSLIKGINDGLLYKDKKTI